MKTLVVTLALAGACVLVVYTQSRSAPDTARLDATAQELAQLGQLGQRIARIEQALRLIAERGEQPTAAAGRAAAGAARGTSGAAKDGAVEAAVEDDPAVAAVLEKAGKGASSCARQSPTSARRRRRARARRPRRARASSKSSARGRTASTTGA